MSDAQAPNFDTSDAPTVREITITRVFDAPVDRVWAAFTEPDELTKWYGPLGFTCPSAEFDPRSGGAFKIIMRGPDGQDYPDEGTVEEIDPPTRLVLSHAPTAHDGTSLMQARTTMTFVEREGKTEFTLRARGEALTPEAVPMLGGMEAGWAQSLRKLDDVFTGAEDRQILTMKMLQAPREKVWAALTDPDALSQWFGPDGFTLTTRSFDLRVGGKWDFTMHGPDGTDYENLVTFEQIDPPTRLSGLHASPAEDEMPSFRESVDLDEMLGMTILTLKAVFDSAEERDFSAEKSGAIEGAEQHLARLEAFLA